MATESVLIGAVMLIDSWEALDCHANAWNKAWTASPELHREPYHYDWIRLDEAGLSARRGRPFCIVAENWKAFLPLHAQPAEARSGTLPLNILKFSDERPHRHGVVGDVSLTCQIINELICEMRRDRVDLALLSGLGEDAARAITTVLTSAQSGHAVARHATLLGEDRAGAAKSDLCAIDCREGLEGFLATCERSYRQNARRERRLAEADGALRLERICGASEDEPTLSRLLKAYLCVDAVSWQRTERPDAKVHRPDYVERTVRTLCGAAILDLAVLFIDDRPAACLLGSVVGGRSTAFHLRYDPKFARWAPGKNLLLSIIDDCKVRGIAAINLLGSREGYKHKMCRLVDFSYEVLVFGATPWGRLAHQLKSKAFPSHRDSLSAAMMPEVVCDTPAEPVWDILRVTGHERPRAPTRSVGARHSQAPDAGRGAPSGLDLSRDVM